MMYESVCPVSPSWHSRPEYTSEFHISGPQHSWVFGFVFVVFSSKVQVGKLYDHTVLSLCLSFYNYKIKK